MSWIILYLLSALFVPAIVGAIAHAHYDFNLSLDEPGHYIGMALGCLVWPVAGAILAYEHYDTFVLKNTKHGIANAIEKCGFDRDSKHDSRNGYNPLVEAKESDMKYLIKKYRKGYEVYIKSSYIEAIRAELLQRNMERNLLK